MNGFRKFKYKIINLVCDEMGYDGAYFDYLDTYYTVIINCIIVWAVVMAGIVLAIFRIKDSFVSVFQAFANLLKVS